MGEPDLRIGREDALGGLAERRSTCSWSAAGSSVPAIAAHAAGAGLGRGARGCRRLRGSDVERVVEARPRRAALPAPRRRAAGARGASRAASASPGSSRPTSYTGCRSCCRCTEVDRSDRRSCRAGSSSTRCSRARACNWLVGPSGRARAGAAAAGRGAALVRAVRGRVDERFASLSRQRACRRGRRGQGAERCRGGRGCAQARREHPARRFAVDGETSSSSAQDGRGRRREVGSIRSGGSRIRSAGRRFG